jgi:hypothetical protein
MKILIPFSSVDNCRIMQASLNLDNREAIPVLLYLLYPFYPPINKVKFQDEKNGSTFHVPILVPNDVHFFLYILQEISSYLWIFP